MKSKTKHIDVINSKVYPDNQFQFAWEESIWTAVYVDLYQYKQSEIIYTVYFSHVYCDLLSDCCKALKMPYLFSFIPDKSTIDNKMFYGEKVSKIKNKELIIKQSAYLEHFVKTFENNDYDIFCPASVHAIFEYDDVNVISIVRDVLIEFLIKSSGGGISESLKIFKKNTKKVLKLMQAKLLSVKSEGEIQLSPENTLEEPRVLIDQEKDENLLTRKQAKELLNISFPTLSDWTKKKKIKSYGIGRRVYYKKNEILESLDSLK